MTSRQHQDWLNHGKPDSGLALPLQLLANTLAAAGYTVYVYPNDAHLDAEPPEDHTYYSETGWPNTSPKWWRHAIDIMPPARAGLPSLQQIGQSLFNARQSGQITWLKYMNWPSDGNLSRAVQDRWEPNHSRGSSSDTGHIHLSSVTGCETLDSSFNPLISVVVTGVVTADGGLSVGASEIIQAWSSGLKKASSGEFVAPVDWEIRHEAFEAQTTASLAALATALAAVATAVHNLGTGGTPSTSLDAVMAELDTVAANSQAILTRLQAAGTALSAS